MWYTDRNKIVLSDLGLYGRRSSERRPFCFPQPVRLRARQRKRRRHTLSNYTEIRRVTLQHDGLPVSLFLQVRHYVHPVDFFCLSWRTHLPSGIANRRFYYDRQYGTGFWRIPVSSALELMYLANEEGMLDEEFEDLQERHEGVNNRIIDSRNLDRQERETAFASIVNENRESVDQEWGADPLFVIIEVPDGSWRKIMIVDTERAVCTFRSTTRDPSYTGGIADGMIPPWQLDKFMQDASRAMMLKFWQVLLEL